jgi:hypothetical protein
MTPEVVVLSGPHCPIRSCSIEVCEVTQLFEEVVDGRPSEQPNGDSGVVISWLKL